MSEGTILKGTEVRVRASGAVSINVKCTSGTVCMAMCSASVASCMVILTTFVPQVPLCRPTFTSTSTTAHGLRLHASPKNEHSAHTMIVTRAHDTSPSRLICERMVILTTFVPQVPLCRPTFTSTSTTAHGLRLHASPKNEHSAHTMIVTRAHDTSPSRLICEQLSGWSCE